MAAAAPIDVTQLEEASHNQLPKLPACRFCHSRKAKVINFLNSPAPHECSLI
jgi:cytochrome c553